MSPCDYINLGYHGLLITMVSFSKFITSQRGGQILVDTDGYLYTLKHKQKTRNTYLCRSHGRKKKSGESATDPQPCPAKLFFCSESEIHLETSHNHEPKAGEPEALDNKTGIKGKAEEQPLTPTQTVSSLSGRASNQSSREPDAVQNPLPAITRAIEWTTSFRRKLRLQLTTRTFLSTTNLGAKAEDLAQEVVKPGR